MKEWYAVYAKSRFEKKAAQHLFSTGLEIYLPLIEREKRWKDRRMKVEFPLFPGYMFVREDFRDGDAHQKKSEILRARGVVRILSDDLNRPIPVPDQEIFNIRTVLEKKLQMDPYRFDFYPEQPIRIKKGPLSGVEGHLVNRKGVQRLVLQVKLLHQAIVVEISPADVEPA